MGVKIGDRVKVYGALSSVDGGTFIFSDGELGIVAKKLGPWLEINMPDTEFGYLERATVEDIHVNQVRKVPSERRKKQAKKVPKKSKNKGRGKSF